MDEKKIGSGSAPIDRLLEGGFEPGVITTIYGPSSSGKTNICMLAAINCVKNGKKVLYIDTEGGFSIERLKQLADNYREILEHIIFIRPINFEEQKKSLEKISEVVDDKFGLVVLDTIAMLYRLELSKNRELVNEINKTISLQLAYLSEIARRNKIPVLITNQVYCSFDDNNIRMVGGDLLKYASKCLIELRKCRNNIRKAILAKHRSLPEESKVVFRIKEKGLFEEDLL